MLTSVKNPTVAAAIRLQKRSSREQETTFLVEGAQAVGEALDDRAGLRQLFVTDTSDPLAVRAGQKGVEVVAVSEHVMGRLTSTVTPQGFVGTAPFRDVDLERASLDGCVAILHEVRDPGNAGTVLRSADAAGAGGVVFAGTSVDPYNPKAVRAGAGSHFHVPIARGLSTSEAIETIRGRGFRILAMTADGDRDLYRADLSGAIAFVFGNEARGLPPDVRELADDTIRVPHAGRAESLNLAAAATVCLFEWARRRGREGEALGAIVAAAAHDIRSPLTAMKGFGHALEHRWEQMSDEQRALMLRGIVHDADRMDTILRHLVDAARLNSGTLELYREQVELGEMIEGIREVTGRDPDHPPIEWSGTDAVVFADPARLRTALQAFIESAVWWGEEGAVLVSTVVDGTRMHVEVAREGTELSTEGAQQLFAPRRPGHGAGSKIGLYVTSEVALAQGGTTWAEVSDGQLRFHLELPLE